MGEDNLIGAWTLVSFEVRGSDGPTSHPFDQDSQGLLIYDAEGNFSVQVGRAGRPKFSSGNMGDGTDSEVRSAYEGYIAYFGTYRVNDAEGYLTHDVELSLFPNWSGHAQKRYFELSAEGLTLTTPPTTFVLPKGVGGVTWKRLNRPK